MRPARPSAALAALLAPLLFPTDARAQLWQDVTAGTIGKTAEWSNKVELADVDGDGLVDILFANGGNYNEPSPTLEPNRIFLNQGPGLPFREATAEILGPIADLARVIKVRDVSGDGIADIIVGTTYQSQSRLYLGRGGGRFDEVTATHLPARLASVGDLELGDVDGDGDLDIVLADWGPGDPFESAGAPVMLWKNRGDGRFDDATAEMPATRIRWSWDLELFDVDNDYDLDVMVSCKVCSGGALYLNRGDGRFDDVSDRLPQFTNNYDFEPIDLDGDGFLDVVTINDGEEVSGQFDRREHAFLNDGRGGFVDATDRLWPDSANVGADDNAIVVLDFDSDGDPDFLIASLDGDDRLLVNDGSGRLSLRTDTFGGAPTSGTLGVAVADLDGDGKLDVVQSQGELAEDERVYFGTGIARDTAAPRIDLVEAAAPGGATIRARVHDNKTPVMPHDFAEVALVVGGRRVAMAWYGGAMWRAGAELAAGDRYQVCATDAAGNQACSAERVAGQDDDDKADDLGGAGGGCATVGCGRTALPLALALGGLLLMTRRRRGRAG
jgi:hypothetical protein